MLRSHTQSDEDKHFKISNFGASFDFFFIIVSLLRMSIANQTIKNFVQSLASKTPTPGGGSSSAVCAAIGSATAKMAAVYTSTNSNSNSDNNSTEKLVQNMDTEELLTCADEDISAYSALQQTWKKDSSISEQETIHIQETALQVPMHLLELCHSNILTIFEFLPHCNPKIVSDAKAGIHQLAGAARAAYQTAMVNKPTDHDKIQMSRLLGEIRQVEDSVLNQE